MTAVFSALADLSAHLHRLKVRWALVGGMAVSARTEPRFTRDLDVAISVASDSDSEAIVRGLVAAGYTILAIVEHEAAGRMATVRLVPPGGDAMGVIVDLLFASSGIEGEIADSSEVLALSGGLPVPVASIGHLLALKILSNDPVRRPQDTLDVGSLLDHASPSDLAATAAALGLITARGFHRGRDLASLLREAVVSREGRADGQGT